MNQTGVRSTGRRKQARTNRESGADIKNHPSIRHHSCRLSDLVSYGWLPPAVLAPDGAVVEVLVRAALPKGSISVGSLASDQAFFCSLRPEYLSNTTTCKTGW